MPSAQRGCEQIAAAESLRFPGGDRNGVNPSAIRAADCNRRVGLLREFRNLHVVRLQQASGSVINRRNGDLIRDLGLQKA